MRMKRVKVIEGIGEPKLFEREVEEFINKIPKGSPIGIDYQISINNL